MVTDDYQFSVCLFHNLAMAYGNGKPIEERGWLRLIGAVLIQAMREFQKTNEEHLRQWLLRDGPVYLDALKIDLDPAFWQGFVSAGCPGHFSLKRKRRDKK